MEQNLENQIPLGKIYKNRIIEIGTALGGPLVAGYFIAENYKVFNEKDKVTKTWIYAVIATIVIFGGIFFIPEIDKIPNHFIPLINGGLAYFIVQHFQGEKINAFINGGGKTYSWGRGIVMSIIICIITIIPILGITYFAETASNNLSVKTYGALKHEINFDKTNISMKEIDNIADGFIETTFFDQAQQKFVFVKKVNNNYEISISVIDVFKKNPEALSPFIQLRDDMQRKIPNNKIIFNLTVDNLDNVVKRLE